ncbi:Hypothetical protein RAK1035_2014 [Roseovarius sp. AK1035]|nr:Hypothetical protein RAK1035_2014 [Roseovarius sp. AK1035]
MIGGWRARVQWGRVKMQGVCAGRSPDYNHEQPLKYGHL